MRDRIMVIARDGDLRGRLARLASRDGYRAEVAESFAHARRVGLDGFALAIVCPEGLDGGKGVALDELRASVSRVLVVAPSGERSGSHDFVDIADEAELVARMAEALAPAAEPEPDEPLLEFEGFRLDLAGHSLTDPGGNSIALSHGEFGLLRALAQRPLRVLSRDQLMQLAHGRDAEAYDRSVDMQIVRLRRKVEPDPKRPTLIVTVAGSGYKFAATVREVERGRAPEPPPRTTHPVDEGEGRGPERRYVVALAAELVPPGGGRMPSDPEDLSAIVAAFRHHAATVLTEYGGVIGERRGCEIVAYFGFPHAQESDGERAVRAALAIQRALVDLNARNAATGAPELAARIGLESGRVVVDPYGRGIRRSAQRRRAGAERRRARRNLDHAGRAPADRGAVRRRGQGRA